MLNQPKSWRKPPFRRGRRYRVLQDFKPLYDEPFHAGDVLEYRYAATSIYDGMDGYFFIQADPVRTWRRWDLSTYDDQPVWTTLFELLPRRGGWWVRPVLLALALVLLTALAVFAQPVPFLPPAPFLPQGPEPRILPVLGMRRSNCALPEPAAGRLAAYVIPGVGAYAAYGDKALLPVKVAVTPGRGHDGIDQLLFGAETTFTFRLAAQLDGHSNPVESLMVPRRPMAALWGAQTRRDDADGTVAYRLALTASVWEVAGHGWAAACLYFHNARVP